MLNALIVRRLHCHRETSRRLTLNARVLVDPAAVRQVAALAIA